MCNALIYIYHVVPHISSTYLSHNYDLVPFDHLHPILPPPIHLSGDHKSDLFFLRVCLFSKYN